MRERRREEKARRRVGGEGVIEEFPLISYPSSGGQTPHAVSHSTGGELHDNMLR